MSKLWQSTKIRHDPEKRSKMKSQTNPFRQAFRLTHGWGKGQSRGEERDEKTDAEDHGDFTCLMDANREILTHAVVCLPMPRKELATSSIIIRPWYHASFHWDGDGVDELRHYFPGYFMIARVAS